MALSRIGNLLFDSFTPPVSSARHAEVVEYAIGDSLLKPDEVPTFVYFPGKDAIISVVRSTMDAMMVEAGVVGSEGVVSIHSLITAPATKGNHLIIQGAGKFVRVPLENARHDFENDPVFRDRVLAFTSSFLDQVTQGTLCNRVHELEARLTKWLLAIRDRVDTDEMHLTHEFLSYMLGVHRPGVSIAITALQLDGLIEHSRNRIVIRDREGLVARACECNSICHRALLQLRSRLTTPTEGEPASSVR